MQIAILYHSIHHHNTERIAKAMAEGIGARALTLTEARHERNPQWDLLGLGSGIFFGKHHPQLLQFAREYPTLPRHCFVFSTAGLRFLAPLWHRHLLGILRGRGCEVIGQFCAPGWDTVGPLKYIGGIHRGRPAPRDDRRAAAFAQQMVTHGAQRPAEICSADP